MRGLVIKDMEFDCGMYEASESIPAGSMKEYIIAFNKTFTQQPIVVANTVGTFNPATELSPCNVSYISTNTFRVRIYNYYSSALTPKICWMASLI